MPNRFRWLWVLVLLAFYAPVSAILGALFFAWASDLYRAAGVTLAMFVIGGSIPVQFLVILSCWVQKAAPERRPGTFVNLMWVGLAVDLTILVVALYAGLWSVL